MSWADSDSYNRDSKKKKEIFSPPPGFEPPLEPKDSLLPMSYNEPRISLFIYFYRFTISYQTDKTVRTSMYSAWKYSTVIIQFLTIWFPRVSSRYMKNIIMILNPFCYPVVLNSISSHSLFIWLQGGIQTDFQFEVHDPYPEHNGEQT